MAIDSAEINVEWDSGRRVLVAPFKIISGANRDHAAGSSRAAQWQHRRLAARTFAAAPSCSPGADDEQPLIFNRIAIGLRFDTDRKRVLLTQADISNGEIGVAGTGSVDYSRRAAAHPGFRGNADVGLRAEADVADPDRSGSARMGDRADRTRLAAAHRGRRQFAGSKSVAARPADPGRRSFRQHRRHGRDACGRSTNCRWCATPI